MKKESSKPRHISLASPSQREQGKEGGGGAIMRKSIVASSPTNTFVLGAMITLSLMQPILAASTRSAGGRLAFMQPLKTLGLGGRASPAVARHVARNPRTLANPSLKMTATADGTSQLLGDLEAEGINVVKPDVPRLRFAPSPTGSLHVGGARTALYSYLAAAKSGGKFVLRIEDTDVARSTKESEDSMVADLKWLGLEWDEGPYVDGPGAPYRQSERGDVYKRLAKKLVDMGHAYPCFCTEEELEAKRQKAEEDGSPVAYDGTWRDADPAEVQRRIDAGEPYTYRFKVPKGKVVSIDDLVRGTVRWDVESTLGDFILLRSTGVPVYNFCVAVDDALMGITTVARAEEHLTNTVRQVLVLEALGFPIPQYAHCSLILGEDRSKLSKRHGATSCNQFREQGYLPEAMINYLALLGWNDGTDQDVYTREELIQSFDLSRVTPSPAMFDMTKLKWINGQHLRAMPVDKFADMVSDVLVKDGVLSAPSKEFGLVSSAMVQEKCELINDAATIIKDVLGYQLEEAALTDDANEFLADDFAAFAGAVAKSIEAGELSLDKAGTPEFAKVFKNWVGSVGKSTDRKGKRLFMPLRLALTGNMAGPDIGDQVSSIVLGQAAGANGVVGITERMGLLTKWVDEHKADLEKAKAEKPASAGGVHLADDKVAGACIEAISKLAPAQQRTILALANNLLETHPPVAGGSPAAAVVPKNAGNVKLDRSGNVEPVTRLDLRVGRIVSCEKHPDADSLYVEKIDVGDAEGPRTVISGLAKHLTIEEMEGALVAVVCNLKPAKMRGIESFGMVLCGSNEEHTKVELLQPAEGSTIGERLSLEAFGVLTPSEEDTVLKSKSQQKVWSIVAPDMRTDGEGRATYRGGLFTTSKGPLTCKTLKQSTVG